MKQKNLLTRMLLLCALIVGSVSAWAEGADVTYDIASDFTVSNSTLTDGTVIFSGYGKDNFKKNTGYFMMGKSGAYINFPLYDSPVEKIVVTGNSGASGSTGMNIFVGDNAASTATTGSTGTNTYEIASAYQAAGTQYTLKVTSNHNAQITKIEIYFAEESSTWSVTYNDNEATSGVVPTDANEYNATNNIVTVLGNTGNLVKTGYTFAGWNTKADGTGTGYVADNTFTISASTTLYAQWTANTHTVTLPSGDQYGTYTMDATNPVAYDTEVTLTYTPATGYEKYAATWSVNGSEISGNSFTMPDEDVTITASVAKVTTKNMTIDFEDVIGNYTEWNINNFGVSKEDITAHGGTYHGITSGATAYIETKAKVTPVSLTCYVSKKSTNTTSSTWYIQVSEDGSSWANVNSRSATDMDKGVWKEFTADLSAYSDVYVRVYYSGSTAIRAIDDLTLVIQDSGEPSIDADAIVNLTAEDTEGEIAYTINNPVDGTNLTAACEEEWISDITVGADKVTFTTSVNTGDARTATITLSYGSLTKDVTVNQAKHVEIATYTLATSVVPGRHYIIVGVNNNTYKAMGIQNDNNRSAVEITVNEGSTSITSDSNVREVLLEIEENGFFTLYDEVEGGYLYAACGTSTSNHMKTQNEIDDYARWTITIDDNDGEAVVKAQSGSKNQLQYNSGNSVFSCYSSTQKNVYLFERDGDTGTQDFTVNINSECTDGTNYYGTFSAPFAFTVPSDVTVAEIAVLDDELLVEEYEAGAVVPANTGVMISSATAGDKTFTSAKGGSSVLGDDNNLRPTVWGVEAADMTAADANSLFYRLTMHNGTQIGFWWGAADGAAFDYDVANRAYLAVPEATTARVGFAFGEEATGIAELNAHTSESIINNSDAVYNLNGQRVAQPAKGLYIVNGRKVAIK